MKKILIVSLLFILCSCSNYIKVYEIFNSKQYSDTCVLLDNELATKLNIDTNRNIIFFYDASCSLCLNHLVTLLIAIDNYNYDSLLIVAGSVYDFCETDYFLQKSNLTLPENTRIIFDPKNNILKIMTDVYGSKNLFLIENKRILESVYTYMFELDHDNGYTLDPNQKIKK